MKIKFTLLLTMLLFFSLAFTRTLNAQFDLEEKIKDKLKDKTEEKIDEGIDKGVDKLFEGKEKTEDDGEKSDKEATEEESVTKKTNTETKNVTKKEDLKAFSKYDFIPGDKIIFFDDFSQDNTGDFPTKWNTNSGGEVVTLNNHPGKWFQMNYGGVFLPEFTAALPENFTIELDAIYNIGEESVGAEIQLDMYSMEEGSRMDDLVPGKGGCGLRFSGVTFVSYDWKNQNFGEISNNLDDNIFSMKSGEPVRISISVQKQRVRLYVGEKKIVDIPRLLPAGLIVDKLRMNVMGSDETLPKFYFSNFRVAVGQPDMRSKLITEGKLVTHGIYFDSGSDKIKPESYATLKEIANVLSTNPDVKVQIFGHTDSDGSDASNLDLSKRRAASVKVALTGEFGIAAARMETDGKGEAQPIDVNTSPEGKANNRRVEFIKM